MKNWKLIHKASLLVGTAGLLGAALVGCGSNPTSAPTVGQQAGQICSQIYPFTCTGGTTLPITMTNASCSPQGTVTDSASRTLTKYTCSPMGYGGSIPTTALLGPDVSSFYSSSYYATNTYVRPGDKIFFQATGYYNFRTDFSPAGCNTFSTHKDLGDGNGLYASDGTNFYRPTNATANNPIVVTGTGQLRVGYNLPSNTKTSCALMSVTQFYVQHCEDSSGTTYPCP